MIGVGSDLIRYDDGFKTLAEYLLGRVVVADSMDNALKLAKKIPLFPENCNSGGRIPESGRFDFRWYV